MAKARLLEVLVHEAEEGGYWAEVTDLPGCFGTGDSLDEVHADIRDAIETYLQYLKNEGKPLPEPVEVEASTVAIWRVTVES